MSDRLAGIVRLALERVIAREERCAPAAPAGAQSPAPREPAAREPVAPLAAAAAARKGEVVIGADHGGYELKTALVRYLGELGYRVRDVGTHSAEPVDYPDIALGVAAAIGKGEASLGIMVDGVGIGSAMAANKVPGIRAAVCFDVFSTRNAREHNDANVMCVGGRVLDPGRAREMVRAFLETDFGGDRHARRVQKIVAIERMFLGAGARA